MTDSRSGRSSFDSKLISLLPLDDVPVHVHHFAARVPCDSKGSGCPGVPMWNPYSRGRLGPAKALLGDAVVVGRNSARTDIWADIWAPYLSPSLVPSFTLAAHSAPLVLGESSRPWRRRDEEIRENFRGANCFSLTPVYAPPQVLQTDGRLYHVAL